MLLNVGGNCAAALPLVAAGLAPTSIAGWLTYRTVHCSLHEVDGVINTEATLPQSNLITGIPAMAGVVPVQWGSMLESSSFFKVSLRFHFCMRKRYFLFR